jgi:hypothetical protein
MDGQSLCGALRGESSTGASLAFTQFFERNSAFEPVKRGTIGVLDGQHQYVFDLETRTGALYDLDEAHEQKFDRSLTEPKVASNLRDDIGRRFPYLLGG